MVDDLAAATEFCAELGLVLQGEGTVEGRWVDRVVGLDGVRVDLAMMQTPDGDGRLELVKFHSPSNQGDNGHAPANTPGLRHLAFAAARTESSSSWRSGSANGSKSVADSQRLVGQSLLATLPTWGRTVDTTWQEESLRMARTEEDPVRIRLPFLERRRQERRELREAQRRHEIEKQAAQRTALRSRDERTGGYGDPTCPGP